MNRRSRRFVLCMLLLGFLPGVACFLLALRMQPIDGDLTRIGAYPERQYGWNAPQRVFPQPLYGSSLADGAEVLVVGDSFATAMANHQWQNRVVAATGLRVSTLSAYDQTIDQVLADPAYRARPPRWLVLTLVERHFPSMLARHAGCAAGPVPVEPPAAAMAPSDAGTASGWTGRLPEIPQALALQRQTIWDDWRNVPLGVGYKYVQRSVWQAVSGRQSTEAWEYRLSRSDLFSSERSDRLLVFRKDIQKTAQWTSAGLASLDCLLGDLQRKVEANGHTRLVVLLAPDKLTAYTPWITDPSVQGLSELDALARRHPDLMPPVHRALEAAIAAGTPDVYLPNNTHWGISGHLIAGQVVADFLLQRR